MAAYVHNDKEIKIAKINSITDIIHTFPAKEGVTAIKIRVINGIGYLFISNFNGQIIIYSLQLLQCIITINSNLRMITAFDLSSAKYSFSFNYCL
jgi:hypothetical protein